MLIVLLLRKIAFFDVTPTGRILNRFTADMDGVDMQLGRIVAQFVNSIFDVVVGLITVIIATKVPILVPVPTLIPVPNTHT